METPYKKQLQRLRDKEVILYRADAPEIKGTLIRIVRDGGCIIAVPQKEGDVRLEVFVAFRDIRGVGSMEWDYDIIS